MNKILFKPNINCRHVGHFFYVVILQITQRRDSQRNRLDSPANNMMYRCEMSFCLPDIPFEETKFGSLCSPMSSLSTYRPRDYCT